MLRPPVLLLCALLPALAHAEIYEWKDEKGRTHFGETVPEKYRKTATPKTLQKLNVVDPAEAAVHPYGDSHPAAEPDSKANPEAAPKNDQTAEGTPGGAKPEDSNTGADEAPPVMQEMHRQDGTGTNPVWVRDRMQRPERVERPVQGPVQGQGQGRGPVQGR